MPMHEIASALVDIFETNKPDLAAPVCAAIIKDPNTVTKIVRGMAVARLNKEFGVLKADTSKRERKHREGMVSYQTKVWLKQLSATPVKGAARLAVVGPNVVTRSSSPTSASTDSALVAQAEREWKSLRLKTATPEAKARFIATRLKVLKTNP